MQYEYKTVLISISDNHDFCEEFTAKINQFGKHGWELVSVMMQHGLGSSSYNLLGIVQKHFLVLKRATETEVSP